MISFKRAKSIGPPVVTSCYVINVLECQCIQNYMSCLRRGAESTKVSQINVEKSCGHRLWRKLSADLIPCQPVGKNTLSKVGVVLATAINLPLPDKYTGHTWRRTAATLAAESGSTLSEIKLLTGHLSDKVASGYIENSTRMKMKLAGAIDSQPSVVGGIKRGHQEICNGEEITEKNELSYVFNNCSFGTVHGGLGHSSSSSSSSASASCASSSSSTLHPFTKEVEQIE